MMFWAVGLMVPLSMQLTLGIFLLIEEIHSILPRMIFVNTLGMHLKAGSHAGEQMSSI